VVGKISQAIACKILLISEIPVGGDKHVEL
jgi:hypothetical protein